MRLWRRWGRVEMVAVLQKMVGVNAKARELEETIAAIVGV
jgi:hypothetical protein